MSPVWGDLVARARGWSGRCLLGRRMSVVREAADLTRLARVMSEAGYVTAEPVTARRVEEAVAELAGRQRTILARWAGERRRRILAIWFEEDTVRSVLVAVRGADVLSELVDRLDGPYAAPVRKQAVAVRPDLWSLELDLQRTFLRRAAAGARRGDRPLRELVASFVDHRNLWTALLAGPEKGLSPEETDPLFLEGGRRLARSTFEAAVREAGGGGTLLARAFDGSLARALGEGVEVGKLREAARADLLREQRTWFRRSPLSSAGVAVPWLALAAERRILRKVAWSLELGVPWNEEEVAA